MSTEIMTIKSENGKEISLTRFAGENGAKLQVVVGTGLDYQCVNLTKEDAKKLAKAFKDSFNYSKY